MTGIDQYDDEVYSALKALIEARWKATRIKWPGETFTKPSPPAAFLAVTMNSDVFDQETIGADVQADNRWDEEGGLWLHLIVPQNTDFRKVRGAAKAVAEIFRGEVLLEGRLEFLHAAIGEGGPGDGEYGSWFVLSVNVDWRVMDA